MPLDDDGFIISEASLGNVTPPWVDVIERARTVCRDTFGDELSSLYLYGSVARGNAVVGSSDLDLVCVLLRRPSDDDRDAAMAIRRSLVSTFSFLPHAGIQTVDRTTVLSPHERYGWQVFLRYLAILLDGEDLVATVSPTRPSVLVAAAFHRDTPRVLGHHLDALTAGVGADRAEWLARGASRRMVQAAFALVMAEQATWETILEEQATAAARRFPEWRFALERCVANGRARHPDVEEVRDVLGTFGRWLDKRLRVDVLTQEEAWRCA